MGLFRRIVQAVKKVLELTPSRKDPKAEPPLVRGGPPEPPGPRRPQRHPAPRDPDLRRAGEFLVEQIKDVVGIPGNPHIRATPGAPPRRITGNLQRSVHFRIVDSTTILVEAGAMNRGFPYAQYHEVKQPQYIGSGFHRFIKPTIDGNLAQLKRLAGTSFTILSYGRRFYVG